MLVKELIEKLLKLDPEAMVFVGIWDTDMVCDFTVESKQTENSSEVYLAGQP